MSPTNDRLTVSEWEADLRRRRKLRPSAMESSSLDPLWKRFRHLSAQTREHRKSAWIEQPEFSPLRRLSDESLEMTRMAQQELTLFDDADAVVVPIEILDQLLADDQELLNEIDAQIELVYSLIQSSETMEPVVQRLIARGGLSARDWQTIVEQFVRQSQPRDLTALVSSPEISVERMLQANGCPLPWLFGPAVLRARWMAALHGEFPELRPYPSEPLITAALLADCGLAALAVQSRLRPPVTGSVEFERHPEVSAALIARIEQSSPLAAVLAGAHHERLDGGGYPRQLRDSEFSPLMRHFTAVVRWSELLSQATSTMSVDDVIAAAATALWRETSRGLFDAKVVTRVLAAVRPDLPDTAQRSTAPASRLTLHSPPNPPAAAIRIDGPQTIPEPNLDGRHERIPARRAARPA